MQIVRWKHMINQEINGGESIPWICSICGAKYSTDHGGICNACSRPVCLSHLFAVEESFNKDQIPSKRIYQIRDTLQLIGSIRKESKNKAKLSFFCAECIKKAK
jgi:hypothetical protein